MQDNKTLIILILVIIIIVFILGPIIVFLLNILYKATLTELDIKKRYGIGSYVIITGASSGQGKCLAYNFAKRQFNLILIGSTRINIVADEIKTQYPMCDIKVIIRDFSKSLDDKNWWVEIDNIFNGDYDISILVNNVGHRSASNPSHVQDDNNIRNSLITGSYPQIRLTNLAINFMISRLQIKPEYKCAIIFNTAQCIHPTFLLSQYYGTGEISVPFLSVYESVNAFGYYHANNIINEYKLTQPNIDMLNIMTGAVLTENTGYLKNTLFAIDASKYTENIIRLLGNINGSTCVYWGHEISGLLIGLMPWLKESILRDVGLILSENLKNK